MSFDRKIAYGYLNVFREANIPAEVKYIEINVSRISRMTKNTFTSLFLKTKFHQFT